MGLYIFLFYYFFHLQCVAVNPKSSYARIEPIVFFLPASAVFTSQSLTSSFCYGCMRTEKKKDPQISITGYRDGKREREREEKGNGIYWLRVKRSPAFYENDTDLLGLILSYE